MFHMIHSSFRALIGMGFSVALLLGYVYYAGDTASSPPRPTSQKQGPIADLLYQEIPALLPAPDGGREVRLPDREPASPSPTATASETFVAVFREAVRSYGIAVLLSLFWPFATIPWMKRAIREDSNAATLKTLLGITAIPLVAFLVYLLYRGKGALDIVLLGGIGALFLFFYTAIVMNGVQNRE